MGRSNHLIQLKMLRPKSKIRKEFLQISSVSSSPENNSKMAAPFLIITSKRKVLFILYSALEEECKFLSKHLQEKQLLLRSNHLTPLKTSRQRSRTRKVYHQINSVSSSLENN